MSTNNNDTQVHFEVRVPAGVNLTASTVNGEIKAESLQGNVNAHTVNGSVRVSTTGSAEATETPDEFILNYNLGGIRMNEGAFQKLCQEVAVEGFRLKV